MTQTKQDNEVIDYVDADYAKNGTKMSWLIRQNVAYDENEIDNDI